MGTRIVRGYWDCKYCGTIKVDGLKDVCPNCGKQKSEDVKYYLSGKVEYLSEEALQEANIDIEDCDGEHPDWICDYCNQLNDHRDEICQACGAIKEESTLAYGQSPLPVKRPIPVNKHPQDYEILERPVENTITNPTLPWWKRLSRNTEKIKNLCIGAVISVILLASCYVMFPIQETIEVTGFEWKNTITVEEERTVMENDWTVPINGRLQYTNLEIRSYNTVLDHYESVLVTKSRRVYAGESYSYRDNGNGTFTEVSSPRYETEYYTETEQKPVYRQEPVYDTRYYYEIEKWFEFKEYNSSKQDKSPYWNTDYTLTNKQRDSNRKSAYYLFFDNDTKSCVSEEEWIVTEVGDGYILTKNRLGWVYSKTSLASETTERKLR